HLQAVFHFGSRAGVEERMAVELEFPAARSQGGAQNGFAFEDIGGVLVEWGVVEVEMGVGVVAKFGAGIQPEVEDLMEIPGLEASAAFVDKADYGDFLFAEGAQQLLRHGADGSEAGGAHIAAS